MLKGKLLHPEIIGELASAGHGSKILIGDGNYPIGTKLGENAFPVYLNLAPGKVTVTEVLEVLLSSIEIEAAEVMEPPEGEAPIFNEFRSILPPGIELEKLDRFEFYEEAGSPDVCLSIATGEQRIYANILLTIGVVMP